MKQFKRSIVSILIVASAPSLLSSAPPSCFSTCGLMSAEASYMQMPQAQQNPMQEHTQRLGRAINEADGQRTTNPIDALARLEEVLAAELPAFDAESVNATINSYNLYRSFARACFDAGRVADFGGQWEKAIDHYNKSVQIITEAAEKTKVAIKGYSEVYEANVKALQGLLEANDQEIKRLQAKDENDFTDEERESWQKLVLWQNDLKDMTDAIDYFTNYISTADREVEFYSAPSRAEAMQTLIDDQQAQIQGYSAPGVNDSNRTSRFVEAIVANYANYYENFPQHEQKLAHAYRLKVLAPESTTVPVLLAYLNGEIEEAELRRVVRPRPAPRGR